MEIPIRRRFQDGLHEVENYCLKFNFDWCYLAWLSDGTWECFANEDSVPKKNVKYWKIVYNDARLRTSGLINDLMKSLQLLKF